MKKSILSIVVIFIFFTLPIKAEHVNISKAENVATNFYFEKALNKSEIIYSDITLNLVNPEDNEAFYVFNINASDGFVIVATDDRTEPIIGYSLDGHFSTQEQSPSFAFFMSGITEQIEFAKQVQTAPNALITENWNRLNAISFEPVINRSMNSVDPLINTFWSQGEFYNAACPEDTEGEGGHTGAGCVAIAMAQIMNFYQYPEAGNGSNSYETNYGTQSINFSEQNYNWNQMPTSLSNHNDELAKIIYHCGVSVNMDYAPNGSVSSPYTVPNALQNNFGYNTEIQYVSRISFTDVTWKDMLSSQLESGMPVFYIAYDSLSQAGHGWVCDGYSSDNLFHMNWGWGTNDGYFSVSNLSTETINLSQSHQAITNIYPPGYNEIINQNIMDWDWAIQLGDSGSDRTSSLVVDNNDNIILSGTFPTSVSIGEDTYSNTNNRGLFLAKYNSESDVIWSQQIKSTNYISSSDLTIDNENNIYIALGFSDTVLIASDTIFNIFDTASNATNFNFALVKLDTNGNMLWYKASEGGGTNWIRSLTCDHNGNVYFSAKMNAGQIFDEITIGSNSSNYLNAKLNENGELLSHNIFSGSNLYVKNIEVNQDGEIIIGGSYMSTSIIGDTTLNNIGGKQYYIASFSSDFNLNWLVTDGYVSDQGNIWQIAMDDSSNIYVNGYFEDSVIINGETILSYNGSDSYFIKYNSSGELQCCETLYGSGNIYIEDIDFNSSNTPFIVGTFGGSCSIGDTTIYDGCTGSFIFSLDAETGELDFVSIKNVIHRKLAFDSIDNLYISGSFNSISVFGTDCITAIDNDDIYLVKLLGSYKAEAGYDISICLGESVALGGEPSVIGGSDPYTYTWEPASLLNNSSSSSPIATPSETTEFSLTVTDNLGNISTDEITVVVDVSTPVIELGADTAICMGSSIMLTNHSGFPGLWSTNDFTNNLEVFAPGLYTLEVINACGLTKDSIQISILDNTSINKVSELNNITIYPNPNSGQFKIQFSEASIKNLSFELYDYTGKLIQSETLTIDNSNEIIPIETRGLENGIYILKLKSGSNEMNSKISIQK